VLGYYKKAEEMSAFDADPDNIRRAFLNLVSGLEDFAIAENTTAHLMGEMSKRIRENLELRRDKSALKECADVRHRAADNARFFGEIEGMPCFSPERAIDGRVENWARCSVGSAYPLLPVSCGSASLAEEGVKTIV
jgi:hypothetical protein